MPSFSRSIAIRRSPEQVFAVLDDLEHARQWMPSIRRVDVLTPGMPMGIGFRWRETRRVLGVLRVKVVLVVSAHDPPRTWGVTYNDGKVQATATFELAPVAHGTQVTFAEEVDDLGGNGKRAGRMARMMERQDGDLLERLKVHVEATTEEPPGLAPEPSVKEPPAEGKLEKEKATAARPARAAKVTKGEGAAQAMAAQGKPSRAGSKAKEAASPKAKRAKDRTPATKR